jgi:predicted DNA-binding transcriptional regulator AlpA
MEKRLLNVRELSSYLSMPTATVYAYVGRAKIPQDCIKRIGRSLKFDKLAIDRWINGQQDASQANG